MSSGASQDPLHGMTLKAILEDLVARHEWSGLAERTGLRCFTVDPSIGSSLKFLRKTEWARHKVERLYLDDHRQRERNAKRNLRRAARRRWRTAVEGTGATPPEPGGPTDRADDEPQA